MSALGGFCCAPGSAPAKLELKSEIPKSTRRSSDAACKDSGDEDIWDASTQLNVCVMAHGSAVNGMSAAHLVERPAHTQSPSSAHFQGQN